MRERTGRVTIPTNLDIVPETIELMKRWGADAIRDCDGTEFPKELVETGAKIYATYYTTRKDNEWAKKNPDEVQQCYIMSAFYTAVDKTLKIPLMKGISKELMEVNTRDDIRRWWEVIDRSTGAVVDCTQWEYEEESGNVIIHDAELFHEYTVSFLAYIIWDPVHMYNAVTNEWKDFEHQITFDVRQPKTHKYSMERLKKYCEEHPYVNVIRYTTFFHQFTLLFDELKREKYVDWYGYSASVSPYILEQFEKEVGYRFRPEFIIDQGYYNNQYRVPSKEFLDFQAFQRREVAKLAKEMVRIGHGAGRKTAAVISEMDEPLGFAVGNALEVIEAIDTLKGNGPKDLEDLCVALGSYMLVSAGKADSLEEAADKLRGTLKDGSAYEKMIEFVTAQGGSREDVENPQRLLHATYTDTITAPKTGYIAHIQSEEVGLAAMTAGGGRETKDSVIDLSAGIVLNKKVGDFVKENEPLARLYANDKVKLEAAKNRLAGAYSFSEEPVPARPLIHGVITEKDI